MTRSLHRHSSGFTLLELIITIVMFGFLAAMLAPFIGSALTRSSDPIFRLDQSLKVNACMAELVAECGVEAALEDLEAVEECVKNFSNACLDDHGLELEHYCLRFVLINDVYEENKGDDDSGDCTDPALQILKVEMRKTSGSSEKVTYLFTPAD